MRAKVASVASTAVLLALSSMGAAFDYKAYRPYKLAAVIKEQASTGGGDWNITAADFRYRISVSFSGEFRQIEPKTRTLIGMWAKALGVTPSFVGRFTQEVRVVEGDVSYWLPIQSVLVEPLKKEVEAGHHVDLFVAWIGSTKSDFIFLTNEFAAADGG